MKIFATFTKIRSFVAMGLITFSRFGFLPANVSPLGSFGFFSKSPWLYFLSIVLFDQIRGGWYSGFWWTYLGFACYPVFGYLARKRRFLALPLLPLASFSFFLFSNFGSFLFMYPRTLDGLLLCYTLALPFYARTLVGDLVFGYGYILIKNSRRILQLLHAHHSKLHPNFLKY